jgi:hypothetical protein
MVERYIKRHRFRTLRSQTRSVFSAARGSRLTSSSHNVQCCTTSSIGPCQLVCRLFWSHVSFLSAIPLVCRLAVPVVVPLDHAILAPLDR